MFKIYLRDDHNIEYTVWSQLIKALYYLINGFMFDWNKAESDRSLSVTFGGNSKDALYGMFSSQGGLSWIYGECTVKNIIIIV